MAHCKRDHRGWAIPNPDTRLRIVYDILDREPDIRRGQIARRLGISVGLAAQMIHKIVQRDKVNVTQGAYYKRVRGKAHGH